MSYTVRQLCQLSINNKCKNKEYVNHTITSYHKHIVLARIQILWYFLLSHVIILILIDF